MSATVRSRPGRGLITCLLLAAAVALGACGGLPEEGGAGSRVQAASHPVAAPVAGWFLAEKDVRRCAFPFCGGYWLYRLNHGTMTCADGTTASRCYVARIRWSALGAVGLSPAEQTRVAGLAGQLRVVIAGITGESPDPLLRRTGELLPYAAYESATARFPDGAFVRAVSAFIACAKAPCFDIYASLLNHPSEGLISGLDVKAVGATAAQEAAARAAMRRGDVLLAGDLREVTVPGSTTRGLTFFATQLYRRVRGRCRTHADCAAGGACDRAAAHLDAAGRGVCIDPANVVMVGPTATYKKVSAGVSAAGAAGKSHVRVAAGTYTEQLTMTSGKVTIVGEGAGRTILASRPGRGFADRNLAALSVRATADVTVQGVTVTGAIVTSTRTASGVRCSSNYDATLRLVEVEVSGNDWAIYADTCGELVIRRSRIVKNGFGVRVKGPRVTIANTLLAYNTGPPGYGARVLDLDTVSALDVHNVTIANNTSDASFPYGRSVGVTCSGSPTLVNTIVWGNRGGTPVQQVGCRFKTSIVAGGAPGATKSDPKFVSATDYHLQAGSPAIDAGTSAGAGSIDLDGKPRLEGSRVDIGAYER